MASARLDIYFDDCMAVLPDLPDKSVDLVLADPPYAYDNRLSRKKDKPIWTPNSEDEENKFLLWTREIYRLVKDVGVVLCFCRWQQWAQVEKCIQNVGFTVKGDIIWDKEIHESGDVKNTPGNRHETILYANKGRYVFHGKRPQSVITIRNRPKQRLIQPNERPVSLMERLVETYCPPGGQVLDCFMGTGATGIACKNLKRDYIGIEIYKKHFEIAGDRISENIGDWKLYD